MSAILPAMHAGPVKILMVDDNPSRLLSYRAILEPLGEELVEASSGMGRCAGSWTTSSR